MAPGEDGRQTDIASRTWSASLPPQLGPTPKLKPGRNPTEGFATQAQTQEGDHLCAGLVAVPAIFGPLTSPASRANNTSGAECGG